MDRRVVILGVALAGLVACGGGTSEIEVPEGAASPDEAVEVFVRAAQEAQRFRAAGELTAADRSYERMAGVFGTRRGSIMRSYSSSHVRDRMIVLAACLRPDNFRKLSQLDPRASTAGETTVTVEIVRGEETSTLAFEVVRGREGRWFVTRIDLTDFKC